MPYHPATCRAQGRAGEGDQPPDEPPTALPVVRKSLGPSYLCVIVQVLADALKEDNFDAPPAPQPDALIGRPDGPHPTHDGIHSVTDDADDGLRSERWRCGAVRYRRCFRQPGGRGRRS